MMYYPDWWNVGADYGIVELYVLQKLKEKQRIKDERDKNIRSGVDCGKFK